MGIATGVPSNFCQFLNDIMQGALLRESVCCWWKFRGRYRILVAENCNAWSVGIRETDSQCERFSTPNEWKRKLRPYQGLVRFDMGVIHRLRIFTISGYSSSNLLSNVSNSVSRKMTIKRSWQPIVWKSFQMFLYVKKEILARQAVWYSWSSRSTSIDPLI